MSNQQSGNSNESGHADRDAPAHDTAPVREEHAEGAGQERLRKLIIGALTAGGVFQLNSWQVQAHGNRSSHSVAALQSPLYRPEDFLLMRQQLTAPNSEQTKQLEKMRADILAGVASPMTPEAATNVQGLVAKRAEMEKALQLRPTSAQSLQFVKAGDVDAAIAVIEGQGVPERVLEEYLWTLLDVAYLGRDKGEFTDASLKEFVPLAKAATQYMQVINKRLDPNDTSVVSNALRVRLAECHHNIASFTLPDKGDVPDDALKLGRDAATRGLEIRKALKQPYETMLAEWMVGKHCLRAKDYDAAKAHFGHTLDLAKEIRSPEGTALGKVYLAKTLRAAGDPQGADRLEREARGDIDSGRQGQILLDYLNQELGKKQ